MSSAEKILKVLWIVFLWNVVGGIGCTRSQEFSSDPKGRLSEYISKSFSVKTIADRSELLIFLTGDVKTRLADWSDDQFREAFIDSKREFIKLLFREVKSISSSEVQITYELTYQDQGKNRDGKNHEATITNKKLCQMVLREGKWLIADVRNIKELVEFKNELSLP